MQVIQDMQEIKESINQIKNLDTAQYYTNLFIDDNRLASWIGERQIYLFKYPKCFFVIRNRTNFWHLYFCATDLNSVSENIRELTKQYKRIWVTDLVGKEQAIEEIQACFIKERFEKYCSLTRMCKVVREDIPLKQADETITYADCSDARKIHDMLCDHMDQHAEQIPDVGEIERAINQQQILVAKDNQCIMAFIYFERHGMTSVWRYWLVRPDYWNLGLGRKVYQKYFQVTSGVRRYLLWVRDDNQRAIHIHSKYGFVFEDIKDKVLILKGIT